VNCFEYA